MSDGNIYEDGVRFYGVSLSSLESVQEFANSKHGQQYCFDGPATCEDFDWNSLVEDFREQKRLFSLGQGSDKYEFVTISDVDFLVEENTYPLEPTYFRHYIYFTDKGERLEVIMSWNGRHDSLSGFDTELEWRARGDSADNLMNKIRITQNAF